MIKYLVLDMGKVLVAPATGLWLVTKEFMLNVDISKIDENKLRAAVKNNLHLIYHTKSVNLEEERKVYENFYTAVFKEIDYNIDKKKLDNIVNEFTYDTKDSKFYLYENVKEELERLSKKYTLIMLSDNWPDSVEYMKKHDIYKYFKKIYISSYYGTRKLEEKLFDYPIKDFKIKKGEALFIDDNEKLLDIGEKKGMEVMLMDRNKEVKKSKYKVINDFSNL